MATKWFQPGLSVNRMFDPRTLFVACIVAAVIRTAIDGVLHRQTGLPAVVAGVLLGIVAVVAPILLVFRKTTKQERWLLVPLAVTAMIFAGSIYRVEQAIRALAVAFGVATGPLDDPYSWYLIGGILMPFVLSLAVAGFVSGYVHRSWRPRLWTTSPATRWLTPLRDKGTAWAMAAPAVYIGGLSIGGPRGVGPLGWGSVICVAALLLLTTATLLEFVSKRLGVLPDKPTGMSPDQERRWYCAQFGAECTPASPGRNVLVTRGVWWRDPLIVANVGERGRPRWMVYSGRVGWDKQALNVRESVFPQLRPDLAPLMGLPPGWIISTEPPDVRYAPEVAAKVGRAMEGCKATALPAGHKRNPEPAVP